MTSVIVSRRQHVIIATVSRRNRGLPPRAALAPLLVGILGSCVDIEREGFMCSDQGRCPTGFTCNELDKRCYRPASMPDAASEAQDVAPAPDAPVDEDGSPGMDGDPDAQPECDGSSPPRCSGPGSRRVCSSGTWTTIACEPTAPACIEGVGCTACTEHDECPGSACHLSGPKQGTCFDPLHVVSAGKASDVLDAVGSLSKPGELAILLRSPIATSQEILIGADQEVAIVGEPGLTWRGGIATYEFRTPMIQLTGGTLYFARIRLEDTQPGCSGIATTTGSTIWIDDAVISGYAIAVNSGGRELHVRRSILRGAGPVTMNVAAGTLFMHTSVVAPLISGDSAIAGGFSLGNGMVLDIRYSTLVGGKNAIDCIGIPEASGSIRNSILLAYASSDALALTCDTINLAGNYAPSIYFNAAWFVDAAAGDFRLSSGGQAAVLQTARWTPGDPTVDIDGTARPSTGFPGIDQP